MVTIFITSIHSLQGIYIYSQGEKEPFHLGQGESGKTGHYQGEKYRFSLKVKENLLCLAKSQGNLIGSAI